jgi:uncharacterized membrane protein
MNTPAKPAGNGKRGRAPRRRRTPIWSRLRANFLTGLVVVVPVVLTIYLTWSFVSFVDAQILPLLPAAYDPRTYIDLDIPGLGVVVFLVFTTGVGYFAKKVFGKQLIRMAEDMVDRMPVVRSVYNAVKQIVETALSQSKSSFRQACLIEYPRRGIWSVAFVSTDTTGEIPERAGRAMISVFLPTTPNPTSGFLLFVPREDIIYLDMTVEEAAKLVISAGLVTPKTKAEAEAEARKMRARRQALAKAAGGGPARPKR